MVASGTEVIENLTSGFPTNKITILYGPAASGKTTGCMLATIECLKQGKKVIYIDTENGFNMERFNQLSSEDMVKTDNLFLLRINSFEEQTEMFNKLGDLASNDKTPLIIIDSLGKHYRLELKNNHYQANNAMKKQLLSLKDLCSSGKTIIVTNQVYQDIDNHNAIKMVGGGWVKGYGDCVIELEKTHSDERFAVLRKQADKDEEIMKRVRFDILEKGMFLV
ncbi:MAG: AAA family ATPase [Nanoarchaeota archaeon]|nr:AAA family ATPase [Nanoarchaeota archaeon]